MTPRFPVANARQVLAALRRAGFIVDRVSGSHHLLIHPADPTRMVTGHLNQPNQTGRRGDRPFIHTTLTDVIRVNKLGGLSDYPRAGFGIQTGSAIQRYDKRFSTAHTKPKPAGHVSVWPCLRVLAALVTTSAAAAPASEWARRKPGTLLSSA